MPSNYTTNYQLSQWAKSNRILMEDFNADNAKIDGALTELSGRARIAVGNYTGDGASSQSISVGFTPKAVLVLTQYGRLMGTNPGGSDPVYGGLAVTGHVAGSANYPNVEIISGGFKVHCLANYPVCANKSGEEYN